MPKRDPEALSAGVVRLLDLDENALIVLGPAARARAIARFAIERTRSRYLALYRELVGWPAQSDTDLCAE